MKKAILFAVAALTLTVQAKAENWMARLSDRQYVCTVSIPGSHDSATGSGWVSSSGATYSQAQDLDIAAQLNIGIRAFDFRPAEQSGYMSCNHGIHVTKLRFENVLTQLCEFLEANPSEFIFIHLLKGTGNNYISRVEAVLQKDEYQPYFINFRKNLTVGEMRKHILIVSRDWDNWDSQTVLKGAGGCFGWWDETSKVADPDNSDSYILSPDGNSGNIVMQDLANTSPSGKLDEKMQLMTQLLDWSTSHITATPSDCRWVFNFASAYSKTSLGISTSNGYRDNATHTNPLIINYLATHSGPTGIVLMDYVGVATSSGYNVRGDEAVQAIIDNNFKAPSNPYVYRHDQDLPWLHRTSPSMADYNNDGRMDIYFGGQVWEGNHAWDVTGRLCTQLSDGTFSIEDSYASGGTGTHGLPPSVYNYSRWIDYNNDGNLDFFLHSGDCDNWQLGNKTFLYRNNGPSQGYTFSLVENTPFLSGSNEHPESFNASNNSSVSFADYDRDGFVDVVQQTWFGDEGRTAAVFHNNGDGTFTRALDLTKMTHGSVTFGDLDNDGWPDIVETGWEDANHYCEFYIFRNQGDGTFETLRMTDQNFVGMCNSDVCLVDLNGDGLLDIVTAGNNGGKRIDIYLNQGNFSFTHVTDHGMVGIDEATIHAADINYDGRPDLIITGQADTQTQVSTSETGDGWGVRIYLQQADGTFSLMARTGLTLLWQGGIALGDLSGRNAVDLFLVGNNNACTYHLFDAPTKAPSAPSDVQAVKNADGSLTVTWQAASEEGLAASALSYNVYVRDDETGAISMLLPADTQTGRLKTLQDMQNTVRGTLSYTMKPQTGKQFTIGVQTLDPSYVPSAFATTTLSFANPGDINKDGTISIADVTALVNIILGKDEGETPQFDHAAADVNEDGSVSIADVTALVNLILGKN